MLAQGPFAFKTSFKVPPHEIDCVLIQYIHRSQHLAYKFSSYILEAYFCFLRSLSRLRPQHLSGCFEQLKEN